MSILLRRSVEAIRLVIWDLDDTFWQGTLAEGGIEDYVQAHHDIVIELARRGIISSICSKNDFHAVRDALMAKGLWEYFVFPSVSWDPKGPRIAALIENAQLRPATVLFIDDNPSNRGEAMALVPGLQTRDPSFISDMLEDPMLQGKEDAALTRLQQYKLLEEKQRDQRIASGDNEAFLRDSDIRVCIVRDIEAHLDRAIELINRTNQLNFTKRRLAPDAGAARRELQELIDRFDCQAGLIQVADRYGDYGLVGIFVTTTQRERPVPGAANTALVHFCFSCRTLGMHIEQWVYEHLGRPALDVVGDVQTDLSVVRDIDWVRLVASMEPAAEPERALAEHIMVYGGCEAHILSGYLKPFAPRLTVFGNYAADGLFVRIDNSASLLDICDRNAATFAIEAARLGLPLELEAVDLFDAAGENSLIVLNLTTDAGGHPQVRHRREGWHLVVEARGAPGKHLLGLSEDELMTHLRSHGYTDEQRSHIRDAFRHIHEHYELLPPLSHPEKLDLTREMLERAPKGSRVVFVINHDEERRAYPSEELTKFTAIGEYAERLRQLTAAYPYAGVVTASEVIEGVHDLRDANHYARAVYLRLSDLIRRVSQTLIPRPDAPMKPLLLLRSLGKRAERERRQQEIEALVTAGYQCLLLRDPEPGAVEHHSGRILSGEMSPAQFLRNLTRCEEFLQKNPQRSGDAPT